MKKVVTFGEILLRLSTKVGERIQQSSQLMMHYGGAEANVSVSLANFGLDVFFVSKVPNNPLGQGVERHLKANGVHTDYLIKEGERLGAYYIEAGVGGRSTQVTYDRKHSSFSQMKLDDVDFEAIFDGASLFHVTGITPALSPNMKELTAYSLKKAKEKGVLTSFDFNYRSKLWSQKEAGATLKQFLPYMDICSCGELDALYLLGIPKAKEGMNQTEKLHYYYENIRTQYPNIKSIYSTFREVISASTNTLQGNFYVDGKLYQSKVFHIDHIVDRVGGGDAYAAGILYGILTGMNPEETVTFGTAASALKHTIHGDVNTFSKDEISAFAEQESGKIVR
ncbi:sugar kinase [Lederbergia sp. NSJ-179]|uniref:sugar kinase n=1 Tax=Lederbergia sp. NSJ-179 TaxID=2931402 RepID=UPI001FD399E3|nr:sugar kinase [Lederbergia sp. NSJ-179]MCJ7841310.1 sugar kinase [Lederbergia sp. NSJ-179]